MRPLDIFEYLGAIAAGIGCLAVALFVVGWVALVLWAMWKDSQRS